MTPGRAGPRDMAFEQAATVGLVDLRAAVIGAQR